MDFVFVGLRGLKVWNIKSTFWQDDNSFKVYKKVSSCCLTQVFSHKSICTTPTKLLKICLTSGVMTETALGCSSCSFSFLQGKVYLLSAGSHRNRTFAAGGKDIFLISPNGMLRWSSESDIKAIRLALWQSKLGFYLLCSTCTDPHWNEFILLDFTYLIKVLPHISVSWNDKLLHMKSL